MLEWADQQFRSGVRISTGQPAVCVPQGSMNSPIHHEDRCSLSSESGSSDRARDWEERAVAPSPVGRPLAECRRWGGECAQLPSQAGAVAAASATPAETQGTGRTLGQPVVSRIRVAGSSSGAFSSRQPRRGGHPRGTPSSLRPSPGAWHGQGLGREEIHSGGRKDRRPGLTPRSLLPLPRPGP